jgi:hypothetical protein
MAPNCSEGARQIFQGIWLAPQSTASREDSSEYRRPLTQNELTMTDSFRMDSTRYFRLPIVPLAARMLPSKIDAARRMSN